MADAGPDTTEDDGEGNATLSLRGHFLVAMPGMEDARFARSVIFICSHSAEGAMGFVLNRRIVSPTFDEILQELKLEPVRKDASSSDDIKVFSGGPVEQGRGFVVHTLDYGSPGTSRVKDLAGVTATLDVLRAIAGIDDRGAAGEPAKAIMLLGYSGWAAGQLEAEIARNGWLTLPATHALLFEVEYGERYTAALAALGISEELLSAEAGHA